MFLFILVLEGFFLRRQGKENEKKASHGKSRRNEFFPPVRVEAIHKKWKKKLFSQCLKRNQQEKVALPSHLAT
jgi:hypothetical protein